MNNQIKSPKRATFPEKKRKRRQKCSGYCENCISVELCFARLGSLGFSKRQTGPEKPDAKSLGKKPKSTVHSVYAASSKYQGKKGPSLGKVQETSSSAKSLRYEIWGPVPWRDWKTTAMCSKQGMEPCQKIYKLKEKDKATFYSPAEEWVLPAASTKEPDEREFVVGSGACMHMVSKKDLDSPELRMSRSRRPTARCKPEKKSRYMSKNWTHSWRWCFLKQHPQFFHSGSSARITGILTTGPAVKNQNSQKKARELIPTYHSLCHSLSLVYRRVPLHHPHLLLQHLPHKPKEVEVRVRSYGETCCINRQKPKTNKDEGHEEVQSDLLHDLPDWLQDFREIWSTKVVF